MSATLQVRYSGPRQPDSSPHHPTAPLQSYDMKIEVLAASGISPKIFVWQRTTGSATDEQATAYPDKFVCIADPVDMEQYPEDIAEPKDDMPYYRTNNVTLRFRDIADLNDTRTMIEADIAGLLLAINEAAVLPVQETKEY